MALEIERKFLIDIPPENLEKYASYEINQGYLIITKDAELRIRKKGNQHFQTIKTGEGLSRNEAEIGITPDQFNALWPLTEGKRVHKTRYEIEYDDLIIELDIYSGNLEGLYTAEIEFLTEEKSNQFEPPKWFGKDITEDGRYKNKNLALFGIP